MREWGNAGMENGGMGECGNGRMREWGNAGMGECGIGEILY